MKLFLILVFYSILGFSAQPEKVVLGFIPGENPEKLKKNGQELAVILEKKLNIPIEVVVPENYEGLVTAMANKKVDFGFFTALTFVEAEQKAQAKVLLKKVWGAPFYYSALVTLKKNKINALKELKGKKIGFVDEKSASGYLYPQVMFKKQKIDAKKYFSQAKFYGNHEAAVEALFKEEVAAVTVYADDDKAKTGIWSKSPLFKNNIQVLWVSEPIPNDPFCVRNDFYEKYPRYTHDLMFTLIDMQESTDGKKILKEYLGADGFTFATSRQYEPVRELSRVLK